MSRPFPSAGSPPRRIHIERIHQRLWKFEILADDGSLIDYSLSSSLGLLWRMAKSSFKRADKATGDHS